MTDEPGRTGAPGTAGPPDGDARPVPRSTYVIGFADSFGLGIYLAFSAVYLSRVVGLDNTAIGVVLGVSGLASIVGAIPIGRLADRLGPRPSLTGLFLLRAVAFAGLAVVSSFGGALVAAAAAGLLSRGIGPIIQSTVLAGARGGSADDTAVRALARLRALRNGGIALGALPASLAISVGDPLGYRLVLLLSTVLFLACAAGSRTLSGDAASRTRTGASAGTLRNRPFLGVTVLYGLLTLSAIVLGVGFPLWIIQRTQAPSWSVGLVQILNTVLVVGLQVYVSRGTERPARARALMSVGGVAAAAGAVLIPLTALPGSALVALGLVVSVVLVFTFAEMCVTAGSMGVALTHMPAEAKATYLATFNLGFGAATVVGPSAVGFAIGLGTTGWLAWAALFLLGGVLTLLLPVHRPLRPSTDGTPA